MTARFAAAGALAALLAAACGGSEDKAAWQVCDRSNRGADERIAACSREIEAGRLRGAELAKRYYRRGTLWAEKRDDERALADFTQAMGLDAHDARAYNDRGIVWRRKGDEARALADFSEAIRLDDHYAIAYNNRGTVQADPARAIADYDAAIRLKPDYGAAYFNRASVRLARGEREPAVADYAEAVRLDPGNGEAHNALAWIFATAKEERLRDGRRALEHATKACELAGWSSGAFLDTLAAAYAEAGRYDDAARREEEALAMPDFANTFGAGAKERLALYRSGKPYRE
jgi:tetratricopeptide (TPR) repeat protein